MSPRLTRSTSKRAKGGEELLQFSPPNQEENARREAARIAADQDDHKRRVQQARDNGRLLVFSPSNRDFVPHQSPTGQDVQPTDESKDTSAMTEEESNSKQSALLPVQDNEELKTELQRLHAGMDKLLQAKALSESTDSERLQEADKLVMEAYQLRAETLLIANAKLESTNEKLSVELKDVETKLAAEKQAGLVETTRLQSQLQAAGSESTLRLSALEDTRQRLQDQVSTLQEDKLDLVKKVTEWEQEVRLVKQKLQDSKSMLQALRAESESETNALATNQGNLQQVNASLSTELDTVQKARDTLQTKIDQYKEAIDKLENQILPASESKLEQVSAELQQRQRSIDKLEHELTEYKTVVSDLQQEIVELNREREQDRESFQQLNEDSSKTYGTLRAECADKNIKIEKLVEELGQVQEQVQAEQKAAQDTAESLRHVQQDMQTRVDQLNSALEDTMMQLEQSEQDKKVLQGKLSSVLQEIEDVAAAKTAALCKNSETSTALQDLQGSFSSEQVARQQMETIAREREHRIADLERELKSTTHDRDQARQNMEGFDDREEELYRKLRESDRIRRDLHARVMQLMGSIRVFVRVRPPLPGEAEKEAARITAAAAADSAADSKKRKRDDTRSAAEEPFRYPGVYDRDEKKAATGTTTSQGADDLTKNIIEVMEPHKDRGGLSDRRKKWRFGFDSVFSPEHGQDNVWEATEPLVQSTIDGYNVTIFAYGQTGSGKTYTMLGEDGCEGIIARSVKKLFDMKREMEALSRGDTQVALSVELLEVYNEEVRDLLAPNSGPNGREIPLKVTSKEVVGNVVVATSSEEEVMHVLAVAQSRRCVKATSSNAESSRSHMLFTIHFDVTVKDGIKRSGKLNVCDLAGSERLNKSGAHNVGVRYQSRVHAWSLMFCLVALLIVVSHVLLCLAFFTS